MLISGHILGSDANDLITKFQMKRFDFGAIKSMVQKFRGHFGIVFQDGNKTIAITDCIASFPIFCRLIDGSLNISTCVSALSKDCSIEDRQAKALLLSGYTVGSGTIFREVFALEHGQIIFNRSHQKTHFVRYYQFKPWQKAFHLNHGQLKKKLVEVMLQSVERIVEQASNRMIAVPLSAGLDSRMVVSGLKFVGVKNVLCYSYGPPGNFEGKVAKLIADKLGFDWTFVEVTPTIQRNFWKTNVPHDFAKQSNDCLAAPVYHDLFVTYALLQKNIIQSDTLLVNGNSGDFITGNHIPLDVSNVSAVCSRDNVRDLVNNILSKHYAMWQELRSPVTLGAIESLLMSQLEEVRGFDGSKSLAALYEYLEMTNRQIKWVIKRQKIYDFFSLDWSLPLWDRDLMNFWERVPLKYKLQQALYKEVLQEQNWGGVWQDMPSNNERFVSPRWMRYGARPIFKLLLLPFGRASWHKFEKRFLDYWLDELGLYGPFGYQAMIKEKNTPRNCLAPHIRQYAREMGLEEI